MTEQGRDSLPTLFLKCGQSSVSNECLCGLYLLFFILFFVANSQTSACVDVSVETCLVFIVSLIVCLSLAKRMIILDSSLGLGLDKTR